MKNNDRQMIAERIAEELEGGQIVNLGIGIPTLVTSFIKDKEIHLQTENGLLGMDRPPLEDEIDIELINAGKEPVTYAENASFFDSSDSFALIRGGHVDVAVLGVLQVNTRGEIANWAVPDQPILGVGGAMDLVSGAKKVIIASTLFAKDGTPKLVKELTYKTSGIRRVELFVSDFAVFEFTAEGPKVKELLKDITLQDLSDKVGFKLQYA